MTDTEALTPRQQEVLDYIRDFINTRCVSPTFRQIAAHFKININAVAQHIRALEQKGSLRREHHKARVMRVVGDGESEWNQALKAAADVANQHDAWEVADRIMKLQRE